MRTLSLLTLFLSLAGFGLTQTASEWRYVDSPVYESSSGATSYSAPATSYSPVTYDSSAPVAKSTRRYISAAQYKAKRGTGGFGGFGGMGGMGGIFGQGASSPENVSIPTGAGWKFGDYVTPHLHANIAYAESDAEISSLARHAADPRDEFTVQGIEPGLSLRTKYVDGFANWRFNYDGDDWDNDNREAFLVFPRIGKGIEARVGRFLTNFGERNTERLHEWNWIDSSLATARFLGSDDHITEGAEMTFPLTTFLPSFNSALTVSVGGTRDTEFDDNDRLAGIGPESRVWNVRYAMVKNNISGGVSLLTGDNALDDQSQVYGADINYRKDGLLWKTEVMARQVDFGDGLNALVEDELGELVTQRVSVDQQTEVGAFSEILLTPEARYSVGLRAGFTEGISDIGVAEELRVSPLFIWRPEGRDNLAIKAQANYFDMDVDEEWTVMLGASYSMGPPAVR